MRSFEWQTKTLERLVHQRDLKHQNKRDKELENLAENYKWVVNLADKELTPAEQSLLRKGPKFAITPAKIPAKTYITCAESKLKDLTPSCEVDRTRHDITRLLEKAKLPTPNITKAETRALKG